MSYRAGARSPVNSAIANQTITSTTFVDLDTETVTVRRKQMVVVSVDIGLGGAAGALDEFDYQIVDELGNVLASGRVSYSTGINSPGLTLTGHQEVAAGATKTYKLQGKVVSAGDQAQTATGSFGQGYLTVWLVDS